MGISSNSQKMAKSDIWWRQVFRPLVFICKKVDQKMDGAVSFFLRHFGKTRFMLTMSKKARVLGLERLFLVGPKAFLYFFIFYLIRDLILYIVIPIGIAHWTD